MFPFDDVIMSEMSYVCYKQIKICTKYTASHHGFGGFVSYARFLTIQTRIELGGMPRYSAQILICKI